MTIAKSQMFSSNEKHSSIYDAYHEGTEREWACATIVHF